MTAGLYGGGGPCHTAGPTPVPPSQAITKLGSLSPHSAYPPSTDSLPTTSTTFTIFVATHDGSRHAVSPLDFPSAGFCHQTTAFAWVAHSGAANRPCLAFIRGFFAFAYCVSCRNVFRSPRWGWRGNVSAARPQHLTAWWTAVWRAKTTGSDRLGSCRLQVRSRSRSVSRPPWMVVPPWLRAGSTSTW